MNNHLSALTKHVKKFLALVSKYLSEKKKNSTKHLHSLKTWFFSIPKWAKNRPSAIKKWRKEQKKKKKYRSFHLQKKIKPEPRYIPTSFKLLKESFVFLLKNKKVFFFIICIHALIYFLVIRSPISANINNIQDSINNVLGENSQQTTRGVVATLGTVLSVSGSSQANVTLVTVSIVMMSLVYIWAIRELHAKKPIKARDAYYKSMAPILPSSMVLIVASLQLLPFAIAAFVYSVARTGGLFASAFEDILFFTIAVLMAMISLYWMTSTIIALYIVTLPGMYPMQSLRMAKKLVQFQRFNVFRRVFTLPFLLALIYLIILVLVIRFATSQVFFAVELMQLLVLPVLHTYLYKLYRALI